MISSLFSWKETRHTMQVFWGGIHFKLLGRNSLCAIFSFHFWKKLCASEDEIIIFSFYTALLAGIRALYFIQYSWFLSHNVFSLTFVMCFTKLLSPRSGGTGWNKKQLVELTITDLNFELSFFDTGCHNKVKKASSLIELPITGGRIIGTHS